MFFYAVECRQIKRGLQVPCDLHNFQCKFRISQRGYVTANREADFQLIGGIKARKVLNGVENCFKNSASGGDRHTRLLLTEYHYPPNKE